MYISIYQINYGKYDNQHDNITFYTWLDSSNITSRLLSQTYLALHLDINTYNNYILLYDIYINYSFT